MWVDPEGIPHAEYEPICSWYGDHRELMGPMPEITPNLMDALMGEIREHGDEQLRARNHMYGITEAVLRREEEVDERSAMGPGNPVVRKGGFRRSRKAHGQADRPEAAR